MKYILGCDTSCDDTSIGIIKVQGNHYEILSNIKFSETKKTQIFGGIVPEIAARQHANHIKRICELALAKANLHIEDIHVFAATAGPGLIGSLIVGFEFTKTLSNLLKKPFFPIHHLEGHMASTSLEDNFFSLIISGGHSLICKNTKNKYEILCNTVDDSAGEVFDKIGRLMNLEAPYGPNLEKLAQSSTKIIPPLSITPGKLKFSFSGLKTHCMNLLKTEKKEDVAMFLQNSVGKHLVDKIKKLNIEKIYVCGGVSANKHIRSLLIQNFQCVFPPMDLCTDNGVMIAMAAWKQMAQQIPPINTEEFSYKNLEEWNLSKPINKN